jgi:hypothetical protein
VIDAKHFRITVMRNGGMLSQAFASVTPALEWLLPKGSG